MAITQGTWGPQTGILGFLNPFSRDTGFTEKLPSSYSASNYGTWVNPNQPSPAYNIYGQPNFTVPTYTPPDNPPPGGATDTRNLRDNNTSIPAPSPSNIPSGPSQPDYSYQAELDAIYNPTRSVLDQAEANLRGDRTLAESKTQEAARRMQEDLEANKSDVLGQIGKEKTSLETGRRSALDDARRSYLAMIQATRSNLGAGSSAGGATQEILNSEYQRGASGIQKSYAENLGALVDRQTQIEQYALKEARRIESDLQSAMSSIGSEFNNRYIQIVNDRASLDSAKAQAKLDLMRETRARIDSLKAARDEAFVSAGLWREQALAQNQAEIQQLNKTWTDLQMSNSYQQNAQAAATAPGYSQFGGGNTADNYTAYKTPRQYDESQEIASTFDPSQFFI